MKPILIHDEAEKELRESAEFYSNKRKGLDLEFLEEIEAALGRIRNNPKAVTQLSNSEYRRCVVNRFPYTIFFRESDQYIYVAAIAHQKRKPGYWLDRTWDD